MSGMKVPGKACNGETLSTQRKPLEPKVATKTPSHEEKLFLGSKPRKDF